LGINQPGFEDIDSPYHVHHILPIKFVRSAGGHGRHCSGRLLIEWGKEKLLELPAVSIFQLTFNLDTLVEPESGYPPVPVPALDSHYLPAKPVHCDQIGERIATQGCLTGKFLGYLPDR